MLGTTWVNAAMSSLGLILILILVVCTIWLIVVNNYWSVLSALAVAHTIIQS
jgi:hypothetical protein